MPLKVSDGASAWIDDFQKSDAPQFKGKTKKERREMAIAAYMSAKRGDKPQNESVDEGIIGAVGKGIKKVASPVTNRLTRSGRAAIAQKKIDKHNTKVQQRDTIKKANAAGKSAFGFTRKQRAANAQKKLDKIAKKKAQLDTIQRAKNLKKGVTAGMEYEGFTKKAVETGKVKTGASKGRMAAMQKQDDNRPTLRKNEGKKMDSAAMKKAMDVFKKRGGKIKKVAPGKAAGYHGKDDPGSGMRGMLDRGDTKGMPRKKKIRSMK
jgi:hypothetical protein